MLSRAVREQERAPRSSTSQPNPYTTHMNALRPSQSSDLNAPRSFPPPYRNPLKRSASQVSEGEGLSNKEHVQKHVMIPTMARVNTLHENVFFDENDFDDDDAIDLDEAESTSTKGNRPSAKASPSTPNCHYNEAPSKPPLSSAPIPWSSSPLAQSAMLPPQSSASRASGASNTVVTKRRTIPWLTDQLVAVQHGRTEVKGPPAHVKKSMVQSLGLASSQERETSMPLPSVTPDSPYPWNKTASAVKKEQKRLRQGHKNLVKSNEGDIKSGLRAKTRKKDNVAPVFLSDEQNMVLDLVAKKNKSVFFTGSAGTGKSVLLREIIKEMRYKHKKDPDHVAVTASTGLAACNIGGVTLHSFAGFGLGKEAAPELVRKIRKNQKSKSRWLRTKVLIIDEVSMVDGDLFDKLEEIARLIRNNGRPFGGIQLVITGDFFQLPPVPDFSRASKFAFDAATWNTSIEHTIGLTQVFRQKDPAFASMLNEMRLGRLTPSSISAFEALQRPLTFEDDFEATELFPTRKEVDSANNARMMNLAGKDFEFKAVDGGSILDTAHRDRLLSNCMAPQTISLKKGAQVMLIKNIDDTLVNGSVGKVIAFMDEKTFDIYHEDEEGFQGVGTMELNDEGMTNSRKKLKQLISKDLAADTSQKWPLVRFAIADGTSRDLLCQREQWNIELPNGEVQASRSQVPLILAWALSIHKAQGQTLDRVKVDLGKIFEKGQAYVALSRATRQEGLQISRFDPRKVMAHDRVRTFYDGLYSVQQAASISAP